MESNYQRTLYPESVWEEALEDLKKIEDPKLREHILQIMDKCRMNPPLPNRPLAADSNAIVNTALYYVQDIPAAFFEKKFGNFNSETNEQKDALQLCKDFSAGRPDNYGLAFFGNTGTGKTHLACASAINYNYRHNKTKLCRFLNADVMLQDMNDFSSSEQRKKSKMDFVREICKSDVIIIDDLNVTNLTPAKKENLFLVINQIYMDCKKLIITSNKSLDSLDEVDPRLTSRIAEMCKVITFYGEDYRVNRLFKL